MRHSSSSPIPGTLHLAAGARIVVHQDVLRRIFAAFDLRLPLPPSKRGRNAAVLFDRPPVDVVWGHATGSATGRWMWPRPGPWAGPAAADPSAIAREAARPSLVVKPLTPLPPRLAAPPLPP